MCVFIKLHITTQSGPVILVILCHATRIDVCVCLLRVLRYRHRYSSGSTVPFLHWFELPLRPLRQLPPLLRPRKNASFPPPTRHHDSSKAAATAKRSKAAKTKAKVDAGKGNSGTITSALRGNMPVNGGGGGVGIAGWAPGTAGGSGRDGGATTLAAAAAKAEEKRRCDEWMGAW